MNTLLTLICAGFVIAYVSAFKIDMVLRKKKSKQQPNYHELVRRITQIKGKKEKAASGADMWTVTDGKLFIRFLSGVPRVWKERAVIELLSPDSYVMVYDSQQEVDNPSTLHIDCYRKGVWESHFQSLVDDVGATAFSPVDDWKLFL